MDKPTWTRARRDCKTCDGSGLAIGHYKAACRNPRCTGPMYIACPVCAGIPFTVYMRCHFAKGCSPHHRRSTASCPGECADCGDPAPIGLYQCEACHQHARTEAGFND